MSSTLLCLKAKIEADARLQAGQVFDFRGPAVIEKDALLGKGVALLDAPRCTEALPVHRRCGCESFIDASGSLYFQHSVPFPMFSSRHCLASLELVDENSMYPVMHFMPAHEECDSFDHLCDFLQK